MGKMSRDKGARFERDVAAMFREFGFDCDRTPNSGGLRLRGDLYGDTAGLLVECKNTERLEIWAALAQVQNEVVAMTELPEAIPVPVVAFTRNYAATYAALPMFNLLTMLRELRELRQAEGEPNDA